MVKETLKVPRYSAFLFTWKGRDGSVEASSLQIPVGGEPGERVWADACDIGFIVEGETSEKLFILENSWEDRWVFLSQDGRHVVTVFND